MSEKQGRSSIIQDRSRKCLTEEQEILSSSGLQSAPRRRSTTNPPEEIEIAVASLKKGKSARVDNIPPELVQASTDTMIDDLTKSVTGSGE